MKFLSFAPTGECVSAGVFGVCVSYGPQEWKGF